MRTLAPRELAAHVRSGGPVLDVREPPMYADAHVRGSLNVALSNRSAPYWLDALAPADRPLAVVTAIERESVLVAELLAVAGRDAAGAVAFDADAFRDAGIALAAMRTIAPDELEGDRGRRVVDVRDPREYAAGHIPGALSIPLAELSARIADVPAGPIALVCASGFRSSIAASIVEAAGHGDLANVWGGTTAWEQLGLPVAGGRAP